MKTQEKNAGRRRLLIVDDQTMLLDVLSRQFADDPALELVGTASDAATALEMAAELSPDIVMLDIDLGGSQSGFDVLRGLKIMRPPKGAAVQVGTRPALPTGASHLRRSPFTGVRDPSPPAPQPLHGAARSCATPALPTCAAAPLRGCAIPGCAIPGCAIPGCAIPCAIVVVSMFDNLMYRNRAFELGADAYATKGVRFETLRALLLDDRSFAVPREDVGKFWRNAPDVAAGKAKSPFASLSERERAVIGKVADGAQEKEISALLGISISSVGTYLRRAMSKLGVATRAELVRLHSVLGS